MKAIRVSRAMPPPGRSFFLEISVKTQATGEQLRLTLLALLTSNLEPGKGLAPASACTSTISSVLVSLTIVSSSRNWTPKEPWTTSRHLAAQPSARPCDRCRKARGGGLRPTALTYNCPSSLSQHGPSQIRSWSRPDSLRYRLGTPLLRRSLDHKIIGHLSNLCQPAILTVVPSPGRGDRTQGRCLTT